MSDEILLYPFEIVINGTPVSSQAKRARSRELWKSKVAEIARDRQRETYELGLLDRRALAITIFYFPSAPMAGDVDNIVKPILDGLVGVAYIDDQSIEKVTVQKFEPGIEWSFSNKSDRLASVLAGPRPAVYIRVDDDLRWRTLG